MTLQTSGPISFSDIAGELIISPANTYSLRNMSSSVGLNYPDSIAEFYGYDNTTNILFENQTVPGIEVSPPPTVLRRIIYTNRILRNNVEVGSQIEVNFVAELTAKFDCQVSYQIAYDSGFNNIASDQTLSNNSVNDIFYSSNTTFQASADYIDDLYSRIIIDSFDYHAEISLARLSISSVDVVVGIKIYNIFTSNSSYQGESYPPTPTISYNTSTPGFFDNNDNVEISNFLERTNIEPNKYINIEFEIIINIISGIQGNINPNLSVKIGPYPGNADFALRAYIINSNYSNIFQTNPIYPVDEIYTFIYFYKGNTTNYRGKYEIELKLKINDVYPDGFLNYDIGPIDEFSYTVVHNNLPNIRFNSENGNEVNPNSFRNNTVRTNELAETVTVNFELTITYYYYNYSNIMNLFISNSESTINSNPPTTYYLYTDGSPQTITDTFSFNVTGSEEVWIQCDFTGGAAGSGATGGATSIIEIMSVTNTTIPYEIPQSTDTFTCTFNVNN